jgi:sortase A
VKGSKAATAAILILFVAGSWELGQGLYIHAKAWLAQHLLESAWARSQAGGGDIPPWPWADTYPVARIRLTQRNVDLIVLESATGSSLAFAPGHLNGTPLPGEQGNSVISGHRDTHFHFLKNVVPGDPISVHRRDGSVRNFRVRQAQVVDARTASLPLSPSSPQLTLVTCYPFEALFPGGPLRYVVTAELVIDEGKRLAGT